MQRGLNNVKKEQMGEKKEQMYVCMYVCMYLYIYISIYIYIYIYIYDEKFALKLCLRIILSSPTGIEPLPPDCRYGYFATRL